MATPISISVNGEERTLGAGETIADLVRELGLQPAQVAVECNAKLIPRAKHPQTPLVPGDVVEVVTLVGGG